MKSYRKELWFNISLPGADLPISRHKLKLAFKKVESRRA